MTIQADEAAEELEGLRVCGGIRLGKVSASRRQIVRVSLHGDGALVLHLAGLDIELTGPVIERQTPWLTTIRGTAIKRRPGLPPSPPRQVRLRCVDVEAEKRAARLALGRAMHEERETARLREQALQAAEDRRHAIAGYAIAGTRERARIIKAIRAKEYARLEPLDAGADRLGLNPLGEFAGLKEDGNGLHDGGEVALADYQIIKIGNRCLLRLPHRVLELRPKKAGGGYRELTYYRAHASIMLVS